MQLFLMNTVIRLVQRDLTFPLLWYLAEPHAAKSSGGEPGGRLYTNGFSLAQARFLFAPCCSSDCSIWLVASRVVIIVLPDNTFFFLILNSFPGAVIRLNSKQYNEEIHNDTASNKKMPTNAITNMNGNCKLLTEAYMEVPIVSETNSINSCSHTSMDIENEESQLEVTQPFVEKKKTVKQQGRKVGVATRRSSRGKGKWWNLVCCFRDRSSTLSWSRIIF